MNKERFPIEGEQDIAPFRTRVREYTAGIEMSLLNRTRLITAASELVRNMLRFAQKGEVLIEIVTMDKGRGMRLSFIDHGPGISNIEDAMREGFTTDAPEGLGMGLPGARKLVDEFSVESEAGRGTRVIIVKWADG